MRARSRVKVRWDGHLSEAFEVASGARQGCAAAPVLFNVFFDFVVKLACRRLGEQCKVSFRYRTKNADITGAVPDASVGQEEMRMLLYADDCVIFAESHGELREASEVIEKGFSRVWPHH